MKGLFQCPPWARSFCPFRACGAKLAKVLSVIKKPGKLVFIRCLAQTAHCSAYR